MKRIWMLALAMLLTAVTTIDASHAAWPDRPIRLVVPYPAGSSSDIIARIVAAKMSDDLGQTVVVDNRAGGSTIIGTGFVAKALPDGYTLGLANTTTHAASAVLVPKLPFDPIADFAPIGMIGQSPFLLVASPTVPVATLGDFVKLAKAKPGALSYASAGTGTLAHLAGELFKRQAGVDVVHVAYRGTEQSLLDLMEGRIDLSVSTIAPSLQQIRSGAIRALAIMADRRNATLPNLPTVGEAGVPGCEAALWTAIVVPAGVPPAIVERLNGALNAAVASESVQNTLRIQGVDPLPGPPEAVTARIKADLVKWRGVVMSAGIVEPK